MKLVKWLVALAVAVRWIGPRIQPQFSPPQVHPLRVAGRTLFVGDEEFLVRELGSGDEPPLLLIHGLAGSSLSEWYQVAPLVASGRRVIMIDHRGHGLSARAETRYEIEDVADEVAAVLDQLDIGLIDVVGYSMGGVIAQSLVARNPGRVRRLILVATFATHPARDRLVRRLGTVLTRGWERLSGIGTPEVRGGYLIARGAVEPQHARWVWRENARRDVESGAQATFALLRFDSSDWISKIEVPTLVVIPAHDLLVPPKWQYELAGLIPGARITEVPGAGHELVWTHPDVVAEEVNRFLGA